MPFMYSRLGKENSTFWFYYYNVLRLLGQTPRWLPVALITTFLLAAYRYEWFINQSSWCPIDARLAPVDAQPCLDAFLWATKSNGGMGNVIFELMTALALAKASGRRLYITDDRPMFYLKPVVERFPKLKKIIDEQQAKSPCPCWSKYIVLGPKCCIYDLGKTAELLSAKDHSARVLITYTQSYKYFELIKSEIPELLSSSAEIAEIAKHELFGGMVDVRKAMKPKDNNICVHIRRGDFLKVSNVLPSRMEFIRASVDYVRGNTTSPIYVMSNDRVWTEQVFAGIEHVYPAENRKEWPPNVEWEFSRLFCDKVIITASASTYGWWMGYLSKGQSVYYNVEFSTPGGIEKEMDPHDFFPEHWISLRVNELGMAEPAHMIL